MPTKPPNRPTDANEAADAVAEAAAAQHGAADAEPVDVPEGYLHVRAHQNLTLNNEFLAPGQEAVVADTAEVRATLAAGALSLVG